MQGSDITKQSLVKYRKVKDLEVDQKTNLRGIVKMTLGEAEVKEKKRAEWPGLVLTLCSNGNEKNR